MIHVRRSHTLRRVMIYQACGLDKKFDKSKLVEFFVFGDRNRWHCVILGIHTFFESNVIRHLAFSFCILPNRRHRPARQVEIQHRPIPLVHIGKNSKHLSCACVQVLPFYIAPRRYLRTNHLFSTNALRLSPLPKESNLKILASEILKILRNSRSQEVLFFCQQKRICRSVWSTTAQKSTSSQQSTQETSEYLLCSRTLTLFQLFLL